MLPRKTILSKAIGLRSAICMAAAATEMGFLPAVREAPLEWSTAEQAALPLGVANYRIIRVMGLCRIGRPHMLTVENDKREAHLTSAMPV